MKPLVACRVLACVLALIGFAGSAGTALAANSACSYVRVDEWPVRFEANKVLIEGAINNQPVPIVLDTGAAATIITKSLAERLGLRLRGSDQKIGGIGGQSDAQVVRIDEFRIANATRRGLRMGVAPGSGDRVLLGNDFFNQVDVEFDLPHRMVRLYRAQSCEGVSLAYWAPEQASQVALDTVDGKPGLNIDIDGRTVNAMLD